MNLKYVPVAVVHGRSDDLVPFAQAEGLFNRMREYYDPDQYDKLALWHDGGHLDSPAGFRPLDFLAPFTLRSNPPDVMIRTDESKGFYWVHVQQLGWDGKSVEGFSTVVASYDQSSHVISATVQDERTLAGGNLPLEIRLDVSAIGFDPEVAYAIEDRDLGSGDLVASDATRLTLSPILPSQGVLALQVTRNALGQVYHQFRIYPAMTPSSRSRTSRGPEG